MKLKILIAGALFMLALAVALPLRDALANGFFSPFSARQSHVTVQQADPTATPHSAGTPANCPTDTPDQPETKPTTDADMVEQQCGDQNGAEQASGTPEAKENGKQGKMPDQVQRKDANEQSETNDGSAQGGNDAQDGQPDSGAQSQSQ